MAVQVALRFDQDRRRQVAAERAGFLEQATIARSSDIISPEILNSWLRSSELGVDPSQQAVPTHVPGATRAERLSTAAAPVLRMFGEQSGDAEAWAMLLDRDCVQVAPTVGAAELVQAGVARGGGVGATFRESLVGTNGAGISAERLERFLVVGEEHYREAEQGLVSVGEPLRDPFGRLVGFLVMCQRVRLANHMIVPYAQNIAGAIEDRLAAAVDGDERAIFEAFSKHSRRPSTPVVGINDQLFVANNAAQQLVRGHGESEVLRAAALDAVRSGKTRTIEMTLGGEEYRMHCRAVELTLGRFGAIVSLSRPSSRARVVHTSGGALPGLPADPLERAKALGLPTLVVGERGSGRAHRVRSVARVRELAAGSAALDPAEWLTRLAALTATGGVLIRDLDQLDPGLVARVTELVHESHSWVGATALSQAPEWSAAFPVTVQVEPLRERQAEFTEIVHAILAELGASGVRVAADAMTVLARYDWRGNVTQLRRVLASMVVALENTVITLSDLPREIAGSGHRAGQEGLLARTERELIFEALQLANWNREEAAESLGISRATMYRRIRQFGFQLRSSR